jgi:hypothetical protein
MRKVGIILIVIGVVGFLIASSQRGGFDTVQGQIKTTFSQEEKSKKDFWENARWLFAGAGAIGVVLTVLPGKRE